MSQSRFDYPTVDTDEAWELFTTNYDTTLKAIEMEHPEEGPFYDKTKAGVRSGYISSKLSASDMPR